MFTPRDYQQRDTERIFTALDQHRAVVYVLPTGGGKTTIFTMIAEEPTVGRVLILAHRRELVLQASSRLRIEHGLITPQHTPKYYHRVQVGMVQTVGNRLDNPYFPQPDLIIVDEAHHAVSPTYTRIIKRFPDALVLGVTATPQRLDGKGLGLYFNDMILGPRVDELTERGYLVPARIFSGVQTIDTEGIGTRLGDFVKEAVAQAADKPKITGDAIDHYHRRAHGKPFLACCVNVAHSEHVAAQFNAAGYRVVSVDGNTPDSVRNRAVRDLAEGRLDGICNCDLFGEGVDIPVLFALISLRPTQSLTLWLQQCGRVLRPCDGKDHALILDHAGNWLRHGPPDYPHEWSLEGQQKTRGKKGESKIRMRLCPKCYGVHLYAAQCSLCGHVYEVDARKLEHVAGELVDVSATKWIGPVTSRGVAINKARMEKVEKILGPPPARRVTA